MTTQSGDTEQTGQRFELRVSIGAADLVVTASRADTVADLVAAAEPRTGPANGRILWCERRGQALDSGDTLAEAQILWGDRLSLIPAPSEPTRIGDRPIAELELIAGPCAGQRWALGPGQYTLGRRSDADIHVDDRALSRDHLQVSVKPSEITVTDVGSSNGTALEGRALPTGTALALRPGDELELGRTLLRIRPLDPTVRADGDRRDGRILFNRPPRVRQPSERFLRELAPPPNKGRRAGLPVIASLVPILGGVVLFLVLKSPAMLAFAALSPLMVIGSFVSDRRSGKKSFGRGAAEFQKRFDTSVAELDGALASETNRRRIEAPDAAELLARIRDLRPSLWERRPSDRDFLALRVGVADLPAQSRIEVGDGGDPELHKRVDRELAGRRTVIAVPVVVELRDVDVIGLAGKPAAARALARWLVIQAAALHSPGELVILAALGDDAAEEWDWLKWLPHLRAERVGLQRSAALGRAESEELLTDVRSLVERRRSQAARQQGVTPPAVLILIDEAAGIDRSLVNAALTDVGGEHVSAIWVGRGRDDLPGQAKLIVETQDAPAVATVTDVRTGVVVSGVSADGVDPSTASRAARGLAPVVDRSELARAGDIPRQIGLLDLLDLSPPHSQALVERWRSWNGDLTATIGANASGNMTVDLRNDGPHALIAGTTGSGKSELLRTFVAAAAAAAPPNRLSFLLVDYKGGSAFAPCAALPHVVDVVSDLDEHMAERALVALRAELKRREGLLAENFCRDLLELERRNPESAPPVLVIAVDEFAKLREEVPEFVDGVVDIAQRGRSLGVHMVLAAQTLRNAFTPAIKANTNLRIALRVADETESTDVIDSPAAARIPSGSGSRGRGFARTGHSELREFQAAYVSGRTSPAADRALELAELSLTPPTDARSGSGVAHDSDTDNDLTALAAAAAAAQRELGLPSPPSPWLPVMPELVPLASLDGAALAFGHIAVGLIDLPQLQRQDVLELDLPGAGNVAVFGGGGTGKSTLLTTAALAIAARFTPEEVRLYGIDAGSGSLGSLATLPHCGGVVRATDEELVDRLLRLLLARAESIERASYGSDIVVVLLDDLGAFAQHYDRPGYTSTYEQLQKLLAVGRGAGIHVILTASRRGNLPATMAAHVGQRLALRMPTDEDMISLGLDARTVRGAKLPPGRGFTQDSQEFQIAAPADEHGTAVAVADAAAQIAAGHRTRAPQLRALPIHVARGEFDTTAGSAALALGIADRDLGPAAVDLSEMHFAVVGPYRSGRSTTLATLALAARAAYPDAKVHLLAPRRSPLRDLDLWNGVAAGSDQCKEAAAALAQSLADGRDPSLPVFVFLDDGGELSDSVTLASLEQVVRRGRDASVRVVAALETGAARGVGIPWIRELRREGYGLLLTPELATDGDLLGTRLPRRVAAPMVPGRGFLVSRGRAELIQVAGS